MLKDPPEISIVIPVYNVEKYLQTCIDSLLRQTFKNIELIFINDASTDRSMEILRKNLQNNPDWIKIIDSEMNLCQGGARNLGIRAARGRFIGFVDSDDLVHPDMYKILYKKMIKTDASVVFIQYASVPEDFSLLDGNMWGGAPLIQWDQRLLDLDSIVLDDWGRMDLMCYPVGGTVCGLWKKDIIIENKIFFPEHLRYEDNYWASLIKCYVTKISFIPSVMYYYRYNPNSTTHGRNKIYHMDRITIEKELLTEVKRRGIFKRYHQAWEYMFTDRYVFGSYFLFWGWFDNPPLKEMIQMINDLKSTFPEWESNRYYQELIPLAMKRKNKIVFRFPEQYTIIHDFFHTLKRLIKKYAFISRK